MDQKRTIIRLALALALLGIGFAGGRMSGERTKGGSSPFREQRQGGYVFINPLLECDATREALDDGELRPFKYRIERVIEERKRSSPVSHVSVYFREMNNGLAFGIH